MVTMKIKTISEVLASVMFLVGALSATTILFAGCGPKGLSTPAPTLSEEGILKTRGLDGFLSIQRGRILSARVAVIDAPEGSKALQPAALETPTQAVKSRTLSGAALQRLIISSGLDQPLEQPTGAMLKSGEITITYRSPETGLIESRTFDILGGRIVQDSAFPDVAYKPQTELSVEWLMEL